MMLSYFLVADGNSVIQDDIPFSNICFLKKLRIVLMTQPANEGPLSVYIQ